MVATRTCESAEAYEATETPEATERALSLRFGRPGKGRDAEGNVRPEELDTMESRLGDPGTFSDGPESSKYQLSVARPRLYSTRLLQRPEAYPNSRLL